MRTKALLGLAALAVSAATCVAQSNVYSLNIVGYVNVDVNPGLNLISNPLKPSNGNYNITNTITLPEGAAYDGASIYKWAGTSWASDIPLWVAGFGWLSAGPMEIAHGESFFLQLPNNAPAAKVLFVGEVATGDIQTTLPPGLSAVANKVPVEENWPGNRGNSGDSIYTWSGNAWSSDIWTYIDGFGWATGGAGSNENGPLLGVGDGVMYQNTGGALTWTRTFNPQ
jgi:hypothetical protein